MAKSRLRLRAENSKEIPIVSSCLQDAIARIEDITYIPHRRLFAMALTRFRWESAGEMGNEGGERVRCRVHFDDVLRVQTQGIDMMHREGFLLLLAITSEEIANGFKLKLHFAGGGAVLLEVEAVSCHLSDFDQSWMTTSRPDHEL